MAHGLAQYRAIPRPSDEQEPQQPPMLFIHDNHLQQSLGKYIVWDKLHLFSLATCECTSEL
jgi:hypothetical protein